MATQQEIRVATKLHKLYVNNKHDYLEQYKLKNGESAYRTVKNNELTTNKLVEHVQLKKTYGVKASEDGLTKFISFDVDTKKKAERDTLKLARLLREWYGIPEQDIHISHSGSKGYHVEMFFNEYIDINKLELFYKDVLKQLRKTKKEIEFRPSAMGVKIPISMHKANMHFCSYSIINYNYNELEHLSQEESHKYLLNIKKIDYGAFKDHVLDDIIEESFSLEEEKAKQYIDIRDSLNPSGRLKGDEFNYLKEIAEENRLIYPNTRNSVSWKLPMFWKSQGIDLNEAIERTESVIINTFENHREYIDSDTTLKFALEEVERLTKQAYEKDYQVTDKKREVKIAKSEIYAILKIKKITLKKLMLSMLIQSKRYANPVTGEFYTAYSTLGKMGNTKNRTRLRQQAIELEELRLLKIVSNNEIDKVRSKSENQVIKKANVYKVLIAEPGENEEYLTIKDGDIPTIEEFIVSFYGLDEIRGILPRKQFERVRKVVNS